FQKKTYETLSFDRDYKSYFPVAITRREGSTQKTVPLNKIQVGDRLIIRHQELIPADSILINGIGYIDYSFVTGESSPEECSSGDMIYAGGKQMGSTIEVEVIKEVSQSYLTQLWNDEAFQKTKEARITTLANTIAKYFTLIVLSIAAIAFFYWLPTDIALAINAFTAVLIIACPCALALSTPFTLGNVLRIWGKNQFYLKNTTVIEALSQITTVVFDKTGTLTMSGQASVNFVPINGFSELTADQVRLIKSALTHSTHPLSQAIIHSLNGTREIPVTSFSEVLGQGVEAYIDGHHLKIGSAQFVSYQSETPDSKTTSVYVSIDNQVIGFFQIQNKYRPGLATVLDWMKDKYRIILLTGDKSREKNTLQSIFPAGAELRFQQTPYDKLMAIKNLQERGEKVLMIGDGLNDAGALRQSDVGITVSENLNNFSPACDAILHADRFKDLPRFLRFSGISMNIIRFNFIISFVYNIIGLSFAVQGTLSPLVSAILMPISSITVIVIATGLTNFFAYLL
ncbi:MAG: HAD family hydrolase, partial [Methanobacteriota archaeon]